MSHEEIALLRGILADPDNDLPRLVYADWLEEQDRSDHDAAVSRFIRLSCDGRPPRRADGSLFSMKIDAQEWLDAGNWRRLVPRLCQEWEKAAKATREMRETIEGLQTAAASGDPDRINAFLSFEYQPPLCWCYPGDVRGEYRVGVPFFLVGQDGTEDCYTCMVRLRFQRGFVAVATWKAPTLGKKIAERLALDQPIANCVGPKRIPDVLEYLAGR